MDSKRWTLGVVLVATVSLWGLVEADASPFASYILSDDLGNMVRGTAAEAGDWENESNDSGGDSGDSDSSGGGDSGSSGNGNGHDNNGHGNNADGVDSSNPSQGHGGPNGEADESCPEGGVCVDDENGTSGSNGNGNGNGKKK